MPLDPFFAERLRVHRRYLIRQAATKVRDSLAERLPFLRRPQPPLLRHYAHIRRG